MLRCLTLLVVVAAAAAAADCPQYCECKWRGGKESAICRAGNLKALPKGLDGGTQLLDLTANAITALAKDAFSSAGLVNLQKVYLSRCRLATIDRYAFRLLINLVELDLTYNELQAVPSHAFEAIAELRELRLSGNPIQRIDSNAFFKVPQLVRLEMSECKISSVETRAFVGLEKSLEWLKLDHNRLSVVRPDAFADMQSLHGLELDGNPWNCTCSLRPFRTWMVLKNVPSSVPAVCALPGRLRGRAWDRLDLDEFACGPRVEALRGLAQAVEGENVTLSCRVQGAPSPNVRWLFRNRVVANLTSTATYASLAQGPLARKLLYVRTAGNSSNLTIVALDAQDAGVYVCVADNRAGKVDASVTLAVSRRTAPADAPLSGKVVAASVLVALLFVLSTCLVALCLWSLRKRHSLWVEQARGGVRRMRHDDNNHYEKIEMMNHKPAQAQPPQQRVATTAIGGLGATANHANEHRGPGRPERPTRHSRPDAEMAVPPVAVARGLGRGGGRRGRYRGVPTACDDDDDDDDTGGGDVDEVGYDAEVEMTPTVSHIGGPWTVQRSSDDTLSSHHSDARGCGGGAEADARAEAKAVPEAAALLLPLRNGLTAGVGAEARALSHHVLRKQVLSDSGGSLYTSLLGEDACEDRSFPDLLQPQPDSLSPSLGVGDGGGAGGGLGPGLRAGLWGTLPRRPHHHRGERHSRRGSESPLLTDSRYGSSGGSTSSGLGAGLGAAYPHQRSSSSLNLAGASPLAPLPLQQAGARGPRRNPSLPGSPSRDRAAAETPILAALSGTPNKRYSQGMSGLPVSPSSYDYHTAQLERFLEEYRTLHSELSRMKETCDSLGANPKSILKKKAAGAGGPPSGSSASSALSPDHPYWVPRSGLTSLARRYSGGDFYPS